MKYFIVTEEELENLAWQAQSYGGNSSPKNMWKAEDACRARPVPEEATHFAQIEGQLVISTVEIPK